MRRLGMWNRLALVATVLFSFGWATWTVVSSNAAISESHHAGYQRCVDAAYSPRSDGTLNVNECAKIWLEENDSAYQGWESWWIGVGAGFLLCAVIYLITWAAVATAKWIWRGRQSSQI